MKRSRTRRRALYVHIGMHTAGSQAIQTVLRDNRKLLKDQSCLYPLSGLHPHTLEQHDLLFQALSSTDTVGDQEGHDIFQQLIHEIEDSNCDRIILSAENLWLLGKGETSEFASHFHKFDIIPILFLRRYSDMLEDLHLLRVNVDPVYADMYSAKQDFWQPHENLSIEDCVEAWQSVAFEGKLLVHSCDDENSDHTGHFLSLVGLDKANVRLPDSPRRDPNAVFSEVIRLACARNNINAKHSLGLIKQFSRLDFTEEHTLIPDAVRTKLDDSYSEQVAQILKSGRVLTTDTSKWRIKRTVNPIQINGMLSALFAIGRSLASDPRLKA